MLIEPNKDKLGDKRLSKEEQLKAMYEDTDKKLAPYRLANQDELANEEARLGKPMSSNELIRRVTKLNPKIWAEDSYMNPTTVAGFYTSRMNDEGKNEKVYIVAFEKGWLPEFSIVQEDRAGLPVKERRGWRTVLVRLLHAGYLTFEQVVEGFGDALGVSAKQWRSLTQNYRN